LISEYSDKLEASFFLPPAGGEVRRGFPYEIWQETTYEEGYARCVFVIQKLLCLSGRDFYLPVKA
jgi:hypothetical protein